MTVVGTVGHVDHGKTVLLRALTGIDADRLPEERRRGMTIDVGYAYLALDDGGSLDFVDLPGHQDLAGNLLVGAGEMDGALLVIAADAGPEAQTFEHLDVLQALGIRQGIVVVTKLDLVARDRREAVMREAATLIEGTSLDGAMVLGASALSGEGIDALRAALAGLDRTVRAAVPQPGPAGWARLSMDRVFRVRGHGLVVTGTLRGGEVSVGDKLRVQPGGAAVRVRRLQVHGGDRRSAKPGGRVALNLAGIGESQVRRGSVLAADPGVISTRRLLAAVQPLAQSRGEPPAALTLHVGTEHVSASIRLIHAGSHATGGHLQAQAAVITLERRIAATLGERFLLRIPSPARVYGGGWVLDPAPPSLRMKVLRERLASGVDAGSDTLALLLGYRLVMLRTDLSASASALGLSAAPLTELLPEATSAGPLVFAPGLAGAFEERATAALSDGSASHATPGILFGELQQRMATWVWHMGGITRTDALSAVASLLAEMITAGRLRRVGELVVDPATTPTATWLADAEAKLLEALGASRPPGLAAAARDAGYPVEALADLVSSGRLIRLAPDLAYDARALSRLEELALDMARCGILSAASFRDAAATSRRHAVAILDAMVLAGLLRREADGHVPGPRLAATAAEEARPARAEARGG